MTLRTLASLIRNRQFRILLSLSRTVRGYHRLAFVASGLSSGVLRRLAAGPVSPERLAVDFAADDSMRAGLVAWLQLGERLGELQGGPSGYKLRGKLSRKLVDPTYDAAAAFVEEVATLHNTLITQSPDRLRRASRFTLADQDGRLVARSSRIVEPLICEAIDAVIPAHGPVRLLEIGCGSAAYIRYAAERNSELTALGLELQPSAAALAVENISQWGLGKRVTIEVGDVRQRRTEPVFDVATLHQNIYYFPVESRVGVLRHVGQFLQPGGRLLLTTVCQGRGVTGSILNLWGTMTEGCGGLPTPTEMVAQLREAGFLDVTYTGLVPGEGFYSFVGAGFTGLSVPQPGA